MFRPLSRFCHRPTHARWAFTLSLGLALLGGLVGSAQAFRLQTMSPQGETPQVRQARVTFSEAMVPLGDLRQPDPLRLQCAEAPPRAQGRWVDERTWVLDFAADVPAGSRCKLQVRDDLRALGGSALSGPGSFAFTTGGPVVKRAYPWADEGSAIEEEQIFALLLNGPAQLSSVREHGHCEISGVRERIPLTVVEGPERQAVLKAIGEERQADHVVTVRCARPLPAEAKVSVIWARGITTVSGVGSRHDERLSYQVRRPFSASVQCERTNARAHCLPIRPLQLVFSAPVPRSLAEQAVLQGPDRRYTPTLEALPEEPRERLSSWWERGVRRFQLLLRRDPGPSSKAVAPSESLVERLTFAGPFPEDAVLRMALPTGLRDDAGRPLNNATAFPMEVRTSAAPPLAKFAAAHFGILERHANPILPVSVRHVEQALKVRQLVLHEDADIIRWLDRVKHYNAHLVSRTHTQKELGRRLAPSPHADERSSDQVQARSISLLTQERRATQMRLPPLAPKDGQHAMRPFEVMGLPLPQAGLHVVEIESPRLGSALLDRAAPMYVRTSALVTNLGVHFKGGLHNSAVWVTTLDKAQPVRGARVQVSDCQGRSVWQGHTNAQGVALIDQELPSPSWEYCKRPGRSGTEDGYFISARHTDAKGQADLAFVWSTWNQGIEAWRFNLDSSGLYERDDARLHSVLDRTLVRAGQAVSMKHLARQETLRGLGALPVSELPTQVRIEHEGSGQQFTLPLNWRQGRYAETRFEVPADAKLGRYQISLIQADRSQATGSFRVEEFRLPVLTGRIVPPNEALVQPTNLPLSLQINYSNGGGAARLPVRVSAQWRPLDVGSALSQDRHAAFSFEPPRPLNSTSSTDDGEEEASGHGGGTATLIADKLPLTLDAQGAGELTLPKLPALSSARELLVQATYADPNGEVQTLSQTMPLWPSKVVLGIRTESWVSVRQKVATQVLALDTDGKPLAQTKVTVRAVAHRTTSTRKRLVGGFYTYDNQHSRDDLGAMCQGVTDARGLLLCDVSLSTPGEVELIAQAQDDKGRQSQAATTLWVTHQGEVWFGSENQDRMDLIPEQPSYEPGQTARLQVRSPFRHATAWVAIERNGILETRTVELHGSNPTIELKVPPEWAPNVYVSVLAVRGRIHEVPWYSFFTWGWRSPQQWWKAYQDEGQLYQAPTAMVDLSKPAFKYGVTKLTVGRAGHSLQVDVTPDKASYPIRAISQVRIKVRLPDGRPAPAGTEVALAAVDEALLELNPNKSWDVLGAMLRERAYGVETATAQMQIIGKRHFGKKAAAPGGGGGQFPTRELFDTLLLWEPRVVLDAQGEALVKVPLNDSLSSFRIVAIADAALPTAAGLNLGLFGTGRALIRTTQDLQIISGLPPLVRTGDRYRALVTVRNTTDRPMQVSLQGRMGAQTLPEQKLSIAAQSAAEPHWEVTAPSQAAALDWTITAQAPGAQDRLSLTQQVREALPARVQQATLFQLDGSHSLPVAAPAQAALDAQGRPRGGLDLSFKPTLANGLPGVHDFFARYRWTCLEQVASIAIGQRDPAAWRRVMQRLPLYLDEEGLANYFPPEGGQPRTGSDSLTAYLLAISHAASALGQDFSLEPSAQARMESGLIAFVEGRLQRDFWAPAQAKSLNLAVRKLAAIEALSRHGKAQARMLDSIEIAPGRWPTSAVIDWLQILDRLSTFPGRAEHLAQAEQILRSRLNVQGTRLGFSTERDDAWWWLMSDGDVNSVRLVQAVLAHPGWQADLPRLLTGSLQRQERGHWGTTVANAWGRVAVESFARRFEKAPVSGQSRAELLPGGPSERLAWASAPQGGSVSMPWPAPRSSAGAPSAASAASPTAPGQLRLSHEGSGAPWVTVSSRAAVPLKTPVSSGYRINKTITPVQQKSPGRYQRGDILRIRLDIDAQTDMSWVVIDDPIVGGATVLGSGLGRDDAIATEKEAAPDSQGWLAYQERSFESFRSYYRFLPKGSSQIEYTVRLNNPGQFQLPPTRVEALYAPELFGEFPNPAMTVQP